MNTTTVAIGMLSFGLSCFSLGFSISNYLHSRNHIKTLLSKTQNK